MIIALNHFFQKHLGLVMITAVFLGLFAPFYHPRLFLLLEPLLMVMLFLVFLKVDLFEVLKKMKEWKLMAMIVVVNLLVTPLLFYFFFLRFFPSLALGALLLCALPSGVSSPAITDLLKGNTSLSMSITILSSILAPFTLPFLFEFLATLSVELDGLSMFFTLSRVMIIPMFFSQLLKNYCSQLVKNHSEKISLINILIIAFFIFFAIAGQKDLLLENPIDYIWQLFLLYVVFAVLHMIGYFSGYTLKHEDKIALSVSKAYMNNGIGIVLAATFLTPSALIFLVLSEIPWATMIAPFRRVIKSIHLRGKPPIV